MSLHTKIDYMVETTRAMVKTIQAQGHDNLVFSAILYKQGKRMNSIELADASQFSKLIRNYVKTEQPDKVRVELKTQQDNVQRWMKQFDLIDQNEGMMQQVQQVTQSLGYTGLGEAEINDIVQKRYGELERQKEAERIGQEVIELRERNAELERELEDFQEQLEAKKQVEYYSSIIGMALPGLAKFLTKSSIGPALSFLSGAEDTSASVELEAPTALESSSTVEMLCEFIRTLNEQEVASLYLLFVEVEKDRTVIQKVLNYITNN